MNIKFIEKRESFYFILVNVIVAFLGFLRSFAFMKFLDFEELGLLTLLQTGAMFIGFFQIGLINGGYRIIALQKDKLTENTNNVIFSYFSVLFLVLLFFYFLNFFLEVYKGNLIVFSLFIFGFSLLISNWLSNIFIAQRNYRMLNKINFTSAMLSVFCLPLAYYFGVLGGVFCLLIQPVIFSVLVLIFSVNKRPTKFIINFIELKKILHYGFLPFISGIFFLLYIQIERWSVSFFLGTESLGNLYLFILSTSLWVLVPISIGNLFFPKCVLAFEKNNYVKFNQLIKNHFYVIILYSLLTSFSLFLFLDPIIEFAFPKHIPFVKFVYLAIPGFFFRTLADPISNFLNSLVKLKPLLWSDIIGLSTYLLFIIYLLIFDLFSLQYIIVCFNFLFLVKFIVLFYFYYRYKSIVNNI